MPDSGGPPVFVPLAGGPIGLPMEARTQADGGRVYEPGLRVGGACTGYRMVRPGRGGQAGPRKARGVR